MAREFRKPKIKKTDLALSNKYIQATPFNIEEKVSFNFKCLQTKDGKFEYKDCNSNYFNTLLERLRDLSRMSRNELTLHNRGKTLRCHPINFKKDRLSESTFGLPDRSLDDEAWQFSLTKKEHGRVHGYFAGSSFFVVWLDYKHELYQGNR